MNTAITSVTVAFPSSEIEVPSRFCLEPFNSAFPFVSVAATVGNESLDFNLAPEHVDALIQALQMVRAALPKHLVG